MKGECTVIFLAYYVKSCYILDIPNYHIEIQSLLLGIKREALLRPLRAGRVILSWIIELSIK